MVYLDNASTRRTGFYHRHLLPSLFGDVVMSELELWAKAKGAKVG
jgi:hypothetical protein